MRDQLERIRRVLLLGVAEVAVSIRYSAASSDSRQDSAMWGVIGVFGLGFVLNLHAL